MEDYARGLEQEPGFRLCVRVVRAGWVVALSLVALFHDEASAALQAFWSRARETKFVRLDTFEPLVATVGFTWCLAMYRLMDRMPYFWHYRFNTLGRRPEQAKGLLPPRHVLLSLVFYLGPLFLFDFAYPRRNLPASAPTVAGLVLQCLASVWLYDFLFFWIHLAMHKVPALAIVHHGEHHSKDPLDATEVLRQSLWDGVLQVSMNIVALNLLQSHPLSRACHNLIVTYLLAEDHCGYNMPYMLHNVVPLGIFGGPVAHEKHHKTGSRHYQQFFTYLDNSLGLGSESSKAAKPADPWKLAMGGGLIVVLASAAASARWYSHIYSWGNGGYWETSGGVGPFYGAPALPPSGFA